MLCSGCLLFLVWHSLSKADSLSQALSQLLHECSLIFSMSLPEVVYSFSKFMHDSVLLYDQFNRFCRDVYMSYLSIRWQVFWGQKPYFTQNCGAYCLMLTRYLVNAYQMQNRISIIVFITPFRDNYFIFILQSSPLLYSVEHLYLWSKHRIMNSVSALGRSHVK